jgi:hypothetical protein
VIKLRQFIALLAAPVLLLSSCIDSREEIWLQPSGGGKTRITVSLPSSVITLRGGPGAVSSLIDELLAIHPSITGIEKKITTKDKRTTIDVSFHFDSALELSSSMAKSATDPKIPAAIRHIIGRTTLQQDGLAFTGERIIDVGKAIPGSGFFASSGNDHRLQTIIHLPVTPTEHNATRVENNGRTLIWDIPLSTALRSPHIQRIRVRAPSSIVATISITTALVLLSTIHFWRKRRRLRKAENQPFSPSSSTPLQRF